MLAILAITVAYSLGCLVPGYYLVRLRTGRDLRAIGSGKVGATNVGRVLGRGAAALTMVGDIGKGMLAVGLARLLDLGLPVLAAVACAVVAGHVWPAQLGFRGGRGAATAFGAALVLSSVAAVGALVVAGLAFAAMRRVTRAGIVGIASAPLLAVVWDDLGAGLAVGALALIVLAAHRDHLGSPRRADATPGGLRAAVGGAVARDGSS